MRKELGVFLFVILMFGSSAGCSVLEEIAGPPVVFATLVPQQSQELLALTIDNAGIKWVGTDGEGALALTPDNQRWIPISTPGRTEANTIVDIEIDRDGQIWIGSLIGAAVVSREGQTTAAYPTGRDLPEASLQDIAVSSEGNPWFATWGGGVSTLDRADETWTHYTQADGLLDDRVAFVRIDAEGNKWFGTAAGISVLTPAGEWRQYDSSAGFGQATVWAMAGDIEGNLWCATQGSGVVVLSPRGELVTTYTVDDGLPSNTVNDVLMDLNGNKWFATDNGLAVLSAEGEMTTFTAENGLGSNVVTELSLDPSGNVWAATYNGGLSVYQPGG